MNQKGFTLIELVMVIVLIAIIAVVAAPRLGNVSSVKAAAFRDKLKTDIRYAQNLAMTQNRRYRVYFNGNPAPAAGYAVVYDTSGGTWASYGYAQDPAISGNLSVTLNSGDYAGITAAATANPVEFNSLGRLMSAATVTVTVSPGGSTITIQTETGAVN